MFLCIGPMAAFKKRGYRSCLKKKKKTRNLKQTFRDCLDVMEFNSVSITHNPNIVGPAKRTLYGLVIGCCFHHSKLKNLSLGDGNWEQKFCISKVQN